MIVTHDRTAHADIVGGMHPRDDGGGGGGFDNAIVVEQPDIIDCRVAKQEAQADIISAGKTEVAAGVDQRDRFVIGRSRYRRRRVEPPQGDRLGGTGR